MKMVKCRVQCDGQVIGFEVRASLTDPEIRYIAWGHLYKNQQSYDCDDESTVEKMVRGKWVTIWGE